MPHYAGSVDCPLCGHPVSWDASPRFGTEATVIRRNLFKHWAYHHPGLGRREQALLADWVVRVWSAGLAAVTA